MSDQNNTSRRIGTLRSHLLAMEPTAASSSTQKKETIPRTLLHPKGQPCKAEYDYIIVGGGSAGCALAARLAEKLPLKSILLVDAGGDESKQFRVRTPFLTFSILWVLSLTINLANHTLTVRTIGKTLI